MDSVHYGNSYGAVPFLYCHSDSALNFYLNAISRNYRNLSTSGQAASIRCAMGQLGGKLPILQGDENLNRIAFTIDSLALSSNSLRSQQSNAIVHLLFSKRGDIDDLLKRKIFVYVSHDVILAYALQHGCSVAEQLLTWHKNSKHRCYLSLSAGYEQSLRNDLQSGAVEWDKWKVLFLLGKYLFVRLNFGDHYCVGESLLGVEFCVAAFKRQQGLFQEIARHPRFIRLWERSLFFHRDQVPYSMAAMVNHIHWGSTTGNSFVLPHSPRAVGQLQVSVQQLLDRLSGDSELLSPRLTLMSGDWGYVSGCCFGISLCIAKRLLEKWPEDQCEANLLSIAGQFLYRASEEAFALQVAYRILYGEEACWTALLTMYYNIPSFPSLEAKMAVQLLIAVHYGIAPAKLQAFLLRVGASASEISWVANTYTDHFASKAAKATTALCAATGEGEARLNSCVTELGIGSSQVRLFIVRMIASLPYVRALLLRQYDVERLPSEQSVMRANSYAIFSYLTWDSSVRLKYDPFYRQVGLKRGEPFTCRAKEPHGYIDCWGDQAADGVYDLEIWTDKWGHLSCLAVDRGFVYLIDPNFPLDVDGQLLRWPITEAPTAIGEVLKLYEWSSSEAVTVVITQLHLLE
jgi:hypothetical protein